MVRPFPESERERETEKDKERQREFFLVFHKDRFLDRSFSQFILTIYRMVFNLSVKYLRMTRRRFQNIMILTNLNGN